MPIRWNLMLVATLLTIVSVGCGSNSAPRPTRAVPLAPSATAPTADSTSSPDAANDPLGAARATIATSPVLRAPGWLVYLRDTDLYAGDLATGSEQRLTTDSLGAGYAGRAEIGSKTWIYYTSIVGRTQQSSRATGTFAVYRRQLGSARRGEAVRVSRVGSLSRRVLAQRLSLA
jgi:Dipeptidyl peptidase IV (DPP IV) N-terminal region